MELGRVEKNSSYLGPAPKDQPRRRYDALTPPPGETAPRWRRGRRAASAAVHLDADDLEIGNPAKGLAGGTWPGTRMWRLELSSDDVEFDAPAYVSTCDGFLTLMQAAAGQR